MRAQNVGHGQKGAAEGITFVALDHFAFGAIVYQMATGKSAFRRDTAVESLAAILNDEPPPIAT